MRVRTARWTAGISMFGAIVMVLVMAPATFAGSATGTVGAYSLNDSASHPGVTCNYKSNHTSGYWSGHLQRLVVVPPNVYASHATQLVGWRYEVFRRTNSVNWAATYGSAYWNASATTSTKASFTNESVSVNVPSNSMTHTYYYKVEILMFWYKADGVHLAGSAVLTDKNYSHHYGSVLGTWSTGTKLCQAQESVAP
jgi:hypothetical protein